jgi:hypothetical protein
MCARLGEAVVRLDPSEGPSQRLSAVPHPQFYSGPSTLNGKTALARRPVQLLVVALAYGVMLLCLVSCASEGQRHQLEATLTAHVGKSVADFAREYGPPRNTTNEGPNKRGFEWMMTGQPTPGKMPLTGFPMSSQQLSCMVSLVASSTKASSELSDWIIESWHWNGYC